MWESANDIVILRVNFFEKRGESIFVAGNQFTVNESLCNMKLTMKLHMLLGTFENSVKMFPLDPAVFKMVCFPYKLNGSEYFVAPLIHTY